MGERRRTIAGEADDPSVIDGRQIAIIPRFRFFEVVEEQFLDDLPVFTGEERLGRRQTQDG